MACFGETLKLCVSDSNWYPFVIIKENTVSGAYVDILNATIKSLPHEIQFVALPWKRCLQQAQNGKYDGIAGVSFQNKRAKYLNYPSDINNLKTSSFQLSQVEYVIVTMSDTRFEYRGDAREIPSPLRSPFGFSIGVELEKQGLIVDNAALSDEANILKLRRDQSGSVILIREMANLLVANHPDLLIHKLPLKSKSYFLAFSKKSKLTSEQKKQFWRAGKVIREDKALISKIYEKYRQN